MLGDVKRTKSWVIFDPDDPDGVHRRIWVMGRIQVLIEELEKVVDVIVATRHTGNIRPHIRIGHTNRKTVAFSYT